MIRTLFDAFCILIVFSFGAPIVWTFVKGVRKGYVNAKKREVAPPPGSHDTRATSLRDPARADSHRRPAHFAERTTAYNDALPLRQVQGARDGDVFGDVDDRDVFKKRIGRREGYPNSGGHD